MSLQSIIEILAEEQPVDLIDGLWDRHLTVLCGREYAGKSSLALHAVRALLAGTPLLGRNTDGSEHRVIWLPTDPGGRFEVASRAHQLGIDDVERFQVESFIRCVPPMRQDGSKHSNGGGRSAPPRW